MRASIAGTVKKYCRHVVLCDSVKATEWPKKVESTRPLVQELQKNKELIVSVAESQSPDQQLLLFPEHIRLTNFSSDDINNFHHFPSEQSQPIDRLQILVCAHQNRDFRCGCAGPKLIHWFQELQDELQIPLDVWPVSHFGGHRFAANCILYPGGHWYGLINSKQEAQHVLQSYTQNNPILEGLWRGQIGLSKAEALELYQQTLDMSNYKRA